MAENYNHHVTGCLRLDVAFNTPGIAAGLKIGQIPRGAVVVNTHVGVTAAFNAGSTNVLIVGTAADDDALVAAGGVDETAVARTTVAPATLAGAVAAAADTDLFVKYTQTGTAASAGAAWVVVEYVQNPLAYA